MPMSLFNPVGLSKFVGNLDEVVCGFTHVHFTLTRIFSGWLRWNWERSPLVVTATATTWFFGVHQANLRGLLSFPARISEIESMTPMD